MKKALPKFSAGLPTLVNMLKEMLTGQSTRENPSQLSPDICHLMMLDPAKSTVELNTWLLRNFWSFNFPDRSFRDFLKLFLIGLFSVLRSFSERWNASISEETAHNLSSSEARWLDTDIVLRPIHLFTPTTES